MRHLWSCLVLMLALCACSETGLSDFEKNKKRAQAGEAVAQFRLGLMYANGEGVPKDEVEAVKWCRKAADQGFAFAEAYVGLMYEEGSGVPKDEVEAVKWCRKAAEHGLANAQLGLGLMYAEGKGVPKDEVEAVKWYRKAADQGLANAQLGLGLMYAEGKGVPKDDVEGYAWANVSAVSLKQAQDFRDKVIRTLTPEEKARAQQRSTQLFNEIEARKKAAGK